MNDLFRRLADRTTSALGSLPALIAAFALILGWAVTGPAAGFSEAWQLVINTATTIITFLMVFIIQNTQNRDSKAIHLKLDEVIRSLSEARNDMIDIESMSADDLNRLREDMKERIANGEDATGE